MRVGKTKSVCPVCLRVIEAEKVIGEDRNIYMQKNCPEHGEFSALIWEGDLQSYLIWGAKRAAREEPVNPKEPSQKGCPYDCGYCREHRRKGCCVLLELTSRCNLHCPVCFASAGERCEPDLPLADIGEQLDYLMAHGGPFNIQLSGGEPTMRDDLCEIIRMGREKGFVFFQLNTNGIRLAEEEGYAEKLKEAGLDTVFLQFDGLKEETYLALRGKFLLDKKKEAIRRCAEAGLGVVLVPVIAPGVNEEEIGAILQFALDHMPAVRGVHFQPMSYFGRCDLSKTEKKRITIPRMLDYIEKQTGGIMKQSDFTGGSAENPYCSFHASYRKRKDGSLAALARKSDSGGCCCGTSDESRESVSEQWRSPDQPRGYEGEADMSETSSLDAFLEEARKRTFAVSGMLFQDAGNLDLDRLQQCYIAEMDSKFGMVPFCAYNLTSGNGEYLYRGKGPDEISEKDRIYGADRKSLPT